MKNDKYRYQIFLKNQKKSNLDGITESLCNNLITKDSKGFWKTFKSKLGTKKTQEKVVDGLSAEHEISESFATTFSSVCIPNSPDNFKKAHDLYYDQKKTYSVPSHTVPNFSLELVDQTIKNLKKGKAASLDKLTAEHILYAHPCVVVILTDLLNLMLIHEYVPNAFGQTVTFPIPKTCNVGQQTSSSDYRGITVSPIISKIFEYCLLHVYEKYLISSHFQFGFKKKIGCNHAHYTLQKSIEYFIERDSTVNLCSIDISKAFDKLTSLE